MLAIALQALATYAVSWILWRFLKVRLSNRALNNIPGPPAKSIWRGKKSDMRFSLSPLTVCLGSFADFFNLDGWAYHKEIAEKCERFLLFRAAL